MDSLGWGAAAAVSSLAVTYYMTRTPKPNFERPIDFNDQSYILEDGTRCSKLMPKGELMEYLYEDATTLHEAFLRGMKVSNNGPCVGARTGPNLEYEWLSYQEVLDRATAFGSWMQDQGVESHRETIIGIFSSNRIEWTVTEQACNAFSVIPVPLYDTLGDQAVQFIINQTSMQLVVCDTVAKANKLLKDAENLKSLKTIVIIEGTTGIDTDAAKHINIVAFQDALDIGKKNLKPLSPPIPDEIATIAYTSGTTGNPKGVILTHKNIVTNASAVYLLIQYSYQYSPADRYLSFLPLPHIYEKVAQTILYFKGVPIGYFRGDVRLLMDDIQTLKPTVMSLVPRLLNKIYDKVMAGVSQSAVKSKLLAWGIAAKKRELEGGVVRNDSLWDKVVFKKVQALFGGHLRLISTGSAPLEQKVLDFFRCSLGCHLVEGYGQTEAAAATNFTAPGESTSGHVGPPTPNCFVKVVDCPQEGYYAANGQGEVCVQGPSIFKGYYKEPAKTEEALDKSGWLHTGDIGQWMPNGTLKIIDRKKNLFKLAQGEYIAPEKLEQTYLRSSYVAQAFVEGDSLQPYLMAVIVPDEEVLLTWAKTQGLSDSIKELCSSESVKDMILADIKNVSKAAKLNSFEMAKDIHLQAEPFSVENGLLTPTFKNKRPNLRKHFAATVKQLYQKNATTS